MNFKCSYCPDTFPNFKLLVEHYEAKHRDKLKRYEIKNKPQKQVALMYASNSEDILRCWGWHKKDCKIKVLPKEEKSNE